MSLNATSVKADAVANRTTYFADADDMNLSAYIRFALPDISGGGVVAADVQLQCLDADASAEFSVYCTDVGAWTDADTYATLEALSFDTATATAQQATSTGVQTYDITGGAASGITKAYNDSATHVTVKLTWTNGGAITVDSARTQIYLGEENSTEIRFYNRADETYFPRLNITYTGSTAANGEPEIPEMTAEGAAGVIRGATGETNIPGIGVSADARRTEPAVGEASTPAMTVTSTAGILRNASGTATIPMQYGAGRTATTWTLDEDADIPTMTAEGSATRLRVATGTATPEAMTAVGAATRLRDWDFPAGLRFYLTGAVSDGAYQGDCEDSLGGYRSSVAAEFMTVMRWAPIPGIRVDFAAGLNGAGIGSLSVKSADKAAWTPPGGVEGDSEYLRYGVTQVLAGDTKGKYLAVTRTTTNDLAGNEAIQILDTYNNSIGGRNFTGAEAAAGADFRRALMLSNDSGVEATGITLTIKSGYEDYGKIWGVAASSDAIPVMADEDTDPEGVSWGNTVNVGALSPDDMFGIYVKRICPSSSSAAARQDFIIELAYTLDGEELTGELRGLNRVAELGIAGYELYVESAAPDPSTDTAKETGAALPLAYTGSFTEGTYYAATYYRNAYNLLSPVDVVKTIEIDSEGDEIAERPLAPAQVAIEAVAGGKAELTAIYFPIQEGATETAILAKRANYWAIFYTTDGSTPDPETDTPAVVAMNLPTRTGQEMLRWTTDAQLEGVVVKVILKTRRVDDEGELTETTTDSEPYEMVSATTTLLAPSKPTIRASYGRADGIEVPKEAS